jgi:hypothetical protein
MDSGADKDRVFRWLLAAAAVASIVPLFCARHLPMADLPEHVATMATLRHWGDPAWANQEYFELAGITKTPYWLYHVTGALLSVITGSAERANLVLLAAVGLAYPYALRALLRALGRDERLALFGCALFWTQNLTVGLLNFVASVPLLLYGLSLVVRQVQAPSWRRWAGLALVSVAILYLHLSAFALFVAQGVILTWLLPTPKPFESAANLAKLASLSGELTARLRSLPRRVAWLVPAAACAVMIFAAGRAGASSGAATESDVHFTPRLELLRSLPAWLFDAFHSKVDDVIGWLLIATLVVLVVTSRRAVDHAERWRSRCVQVLFAVALIVWFAMPGRVGAYALLLDVRMSVFVALFAVLLPRPRIDLRGTVPLALVGALSLAASINVVHEVRAFERDEVGSFDELLRQLPHGRRLLSLNFQPRSTHVNANPFGYFGSYYRARYGGVASFSFNEVPHWPVQYRADQRPPGQPATGVSWGNPCMFRNSRDGAYFDYLLVRGDRDPIAEAPPGPTWELIGSARAFHLYRRVLGESRPGEEDHTLCG